MTATNKVEFKAEIRQTTSRTSASLDKVYKIVLETDDVTLMDLSTLDSNQLVHVTVETAE